MESPQDFLERWHYAGLFGVIFAEEAGIPLPLPGDLFIAAMGVMAQSRPESFIPVLATVTTATTLGASLLYFISLRAGRPLLLRVARRFGYTEAREQKLEGWLKRSGFSAVAFGRLIPGLRIVMTVVAGALKLPARTFVSGTFVAGIIWSTIYFWLGYFLGSTYEKFAGRIKLGEIWPYILAAVLILCAIVLVRRAQIRRRASLSEKPVDQQ